jgi:dCMP deaminase
MKEFLDNLVKEGKISVVDSKFASDMLREAYKYAYESSTDTTTKNGAVIVKEGNIVSRGSNRFAKNVNITKKRSTPVAERIYQDHSERNAIYGAAKLGVALEGTQMYSTWIPCPACVNGILFGGIKKVVFHYDAAIKKHKKYWIDQLKESINMMLEGGVEVSMYKGKIGNVQALFHKKEWEP